MLNVKAFLRRTAQQLCTQWAPGALSHLDGFLEQVPGEPGARRSAGGMQGDGDEERPPLIPGAPFGCGKAEPCLGLACVPGLWGEVTGTSFLLCVPWRQCAVLGGPQLAPGEGGGGGGLWCQRPAETLLSFRGDSRGVPAAFMQRRKGPQLPGPLRLKMLAPEGRSDQAFLGWKLRNRASEWGYFPGNYSVILSLSLDKGPLAQQVLLGQWLYFTELGEPTRGLLNTQGGGASMGGCEQ